MHIKPADEGHRVRSHKRQGMDFHGGWESSSRAEAAVDTGRAARDFARLLLLLALSMGGACAQSP